MRGRGADEGKADRMHSACGDDVSDGVLFSGKRYPKAAGDTGTERPFQGQTPPFPRTPFGVRPAAVGFNYPPNLKVIACRFGCPVSFLRRPCSVTRPDLKVFAIHRRSQCRPKSLLCYLVSARAGLTPSAEKIDRPALLLQYGPVITLIRTEQSRKP